MSLVRNAMSLVGQTFLESLHLDLKIKTDLLLFIKFGCEFGKTLLVGTFEAVKVAAKLLDLGVQVTRLICTASAMHGFQPNEQRRSLHNDVNNAVDCRDIQQNGTAKTLMFMCPL